MGVRKPLICQSTLARQGASEAKGRGFDPRQAHQTIVFSLQKHPETRTPIGIAGSGCLVTFPPIPSDTVEGGKGALMEKRREKARELLADGVDPGIAKGSEKQVRADASANIYEAAARVWLVMTAAKRAEVAQARITRLLEREAFPFIGKMPMSTIGPRDILDWIVRRIEARGSIDTAHRAMQICGQTFTFCSGGGAGRTLCNFGPARRACLVTGIALFGRPRGGR